MRDCPTYAQKQTKNALLYLALMLWLSLTFYLNRIQHTLWGFPIPYMYVVSIILLGTHSKWSVAHLGFRLVHHRLCACIFAIFFSKTKLKMINGLTMLQKFQTCSSVFKTWLAKGQLISKCLFGIIVSTKKPTKILLEFLPWKFLELPWGFLEAFGGFM